MGYISIKKNDGLINLTLNICVDQSMQQQLLIKQNKNNNNNKNQYKITTPIKFVDLR